MKRFLLALAVHAALATPILADYLVIRINLGAESSASDPTDIGGGGNRGGAAPGLVGLGGPGGGGGGKNNPAGQGQGRGPGGSRPGGLGAPGTPGGIGGPGQRGPGTPGKPGGGSAGGAAGGSGDTLGGGPGPQGPGTPPPGETEKPELFANKGDLFIVALEVNVSKQRNEKVILSHRWGQTVLNPDTTLPNRAVMQLIKVASLEKRLDEKRREFVDNANPKKYFQLAEWMLENWNLPFSEGRFLMHTKFDAYLNELSAVAANLSPADKAKLDALLAVRTQLAKPVIPLQAEMDMVKGLLSKVGADYRPMQKGHYVIFHPAREEKTAQAKAARLENAMAGILYWFAVQNKPLQVPQNQMVCVLAEKADKFQTLRAMFDNPPLESNGFYSRTDNITILAPHRVDASYEKFDAIARATESTLKDYKLDFNKLLTENSNRPYVTTNTHQGQNQNQNQGQGRGLGLGIGTGQGPGGNRNQNQPPPEDPEKNNNIITGQIFALAKNAALDEGEVVTATHEAFNQIAAANGFPPRALLLPQSVREGLASFFTSPKSSGEENLPALWSGIGGHHWIYQPLFKKIQEARKAAGDKATEVTIDEKLSTRRRLKLTPLDILSVITDKGFDVAERAEKNDQDFLRDKARAESWSLTYFLIKNRTDQLKKFIGELSQLPRDMELSSEVVEISFGKAFDLLDAKGEKVDTAKAAKLQKEWTDFMNYVNLTVDNADKHK